MIIDVHAHVFAWPKRGSTRGGTFMSMEQQIEVMNRKGVDKAVILPIVSPETPCEQQSLGEILYICEKYPGRFIPFCNMDPRLPRLPEKITVDDFLPLLEECRKLGFKGIGEMTPRMPWDDPGLNALFAAAEKVGFPITFHTITADVDSYGIIDEIGLPKFEKVLQRFPKLVFLGHSPGFWSEISGDVSAANKNGYPNGPVKPGGRLIDLLRKYPALNGDLSAGSGFNSLARDPAHAWRFMDEFQDRLLLGLDYCSIKNNMQHIEWLTDALKKQNISQAVYEKITWRNANRLLDLGLE